jgi:hypothetical protein
MLRDATEQVDLLDFTLLDALETAGVIELFDRQGLGCLPGQDPAI